MERQEFERKESQLEASNKTLRANLQELKGRKAKLRSQVQDFTLSHYHLAEENEQLKVRAQTAEAHVQAMEQKYTDQKGKWCEFGVWLVEMSVSSRKQHFLRVAEQRKLRELTDATQVVANAVDLPKEGVEACPLVERLRDAPAKVAGLAKTICKQVLAVVKSYYTRADLAAAAGGIAQNCSDESYSQYLDEAEPIAVKMTEFITLEEK
ncbi:uncharacterized protein [Setaria viridis]|uniref:Uncharacterized protein n=1 Tax=Setaria viridis TaxID=4556 RepID=A0A4U6VS83_SETVI|nr:uncharacterized protein LOC117842486 [Setaria viridis]TKW32720.1 hypothetical protein SEVIR_2G186200v2 [Setaria viridis]